MRPKAYYNENDPNAAAWLRELIAEGQIADGEVDDRSIADVQPADVAGFTQCHFFGGVGGWSLALRLAGWPDDRPVWTGSCPCQASSSAARGRNVAAELWPEFRRLIAQCSPRTVFGEQVVRSEWIGRVSAALDDMGYEVGASILPALCVGQDHQRERFYFVGHADANRQPRRAVDAEASRLPWRDRDAGRVASTHGVSRDVVALSGFGNAIVPQVAAEFIAAYMGCASPRSPQGDQ